MAAGRLKLGAQGSNPVLTAALIFVLFVAGVWLTTRPSSQQATIARDEADAEVQALKAGAARASLSIVTAMDASTDDSPDDSRPSAADVSELQSALAASAGTAEPREEAFEKQEAVSSSTRAEAERSEEAERREESTEAEARAETSSTKEVKQAKSAQHRKKSSKSEAIVVTPHEILEQEPETSDTATGSISSTSISTFPLCPDVGDDYIPCLDNKKAIKSLKTTAHYEHRERHCPEGDDKKRCLVPMPDGYQPHVKWPESRDQIWYSNVPRPSLANYKKDQNWVKAEGDKFIFPGGGTQFKRGATQYIEWVQESCPELRLGDHMVVGFDVGCGVASFAAYLEPFGVKMMSIAPKDEHEAQIQFALERGVSAMVGVMGTMRQPYPANGFDAVHCARCRVPWYKDGGMLLAEVNRIIRPGGYFIWSATPLCLDCKAKEADDKEVWEAMSKLTTDMCWNMIVKKVHVENGVAVAVYQKPVDNECYMNRPEGVIPPMCPEEDDADKAWYTPMNACLHKVPLPSENLHGSHWPADGPSRLRDTPAWLASMGKGIYGKKAVEEFPKDTEHWENVVRRYLKQQKTLIDWSTVRNVMDMDAHYGSFAAALSRQRLWTMNVIPISRPNTLPVIFDRGLLGVYHDWCEAFNTYPRTYDLLHSDHLLGHIIDTGRCAVEDVFIEMDRILRPTGYAVVREDRSKADEIRKLGKALRWTELNTSEEGDETVIIYQKNMWRPTATK